MLRAELVDQAPRHLVSRMSVGVRFGETDLMGVVHHASYLLYLEAARIDWLRRRGASYETWLKRGAHLPVAELSLRYHKPARFPDELVLETARQRVSPVSASFVTVIRRGDEVLCTASVRLACVDDALELTDIPDDLAEVLERGELPGLES